MTADEIISRARISDVWVALGGQPPRFRRAPAFWRDTRDRNVALDDDKGTWYDHAHNEGGGVLDLIQRARGGSHGDALRWLADYLCCPLDSHEMTEAERRDWARRRRAAQVEGQRLAWWKQDLLEALRQQRDVLLHVYHSAGRFLRAHTVDECEARGDVRWELAFDLQYTYWPRIERLQHQIDLLAKAPYAELLRLYQESRERSVAA